MDNDSNKMYDFDDLDRCDSFLDSGISVTSYFSGNELPHFSSNSSDSKNDNSITKLDNSTLFDSDDGYLSLSSEPPLFSSELTKSLHSEINEDSSTNCDNSVTHTRSQDVNGDTKLHTLIIEKEVKHSIETIFMSSTHDLELQNDCLQTPLHLAVITNQPSIVAQLICSGVKTNIRERNGDTALNIACENGYVDCINAMYCLSGEKLGPVELLQSDAALYNYRGKLCLHLAIEAGNLELITYLCKFGVDINLKEGLSGRSLLHTLVENNDIENNNLVVLNDFISNCNPDFNIRTFSGLTPIQLAKSRQHHNIVELLKRCGSDDHSASDYSSSESETDMMI